MRLIKPSFEIIEPTGYTIDDIYKSIELAGKVSHKSEHTIKEGSAKNFVDRMIKLGHGATLEFGTVYLYINYYNPCFNKLIDKYNKNQYSICKLITHKLTGNYNAFITTNLRVLVENNWLGDLEFLCEPTEYHEKRICVKFICDRAIANEIVRHRKFSFLQESTRYCNYSKDKFKKELTFIEPCWDYNDTLANEYGFIDLLLDSEKAYFDAIERGWKPEQARIVLPLALKTELYMCGFVSDWKKFFELRALDKTGPAHPQAKELAYPLYKEFVNRRYIIE